MSSYLDRSFRRHRIAASRLTKEVWKDAGGTTTNTVTYIYDNANRLTTAKDAQGAYTFTYDAVGQVTNQLDMWGTSLTFTYDNVGNRTKVQDSFGGLETSVYDAANRLTSRRFSGISSTAFRLDMTYTDANQLQNIKRYNAATSGTMVAQTTYTYDNAHQLTGIKNADGSATVLSHYTYTYDAAGRLTTEVLGGNTTTYTYDTRSQLTGDGTASYGYDNAGNRNNGGQSIGTGNRLNSDSNWTYTYDDEGNLTSKVSVMAPTVTWSYTWDVKNRLTSVTKSTGSAIYSIDYKYDAFGNRIEQNEDADGAGAGAAVKTRFAWEGFTVNQNAWGGQTSPVGTENWNIWADLSGTNTLQVRYVRGDAVDELFARVKSDGTLAYYLTDRMGSVRQMLDASGVLKDTITYDGFGNVLSETDAAFGDRWKWTGREYNATTLLQYNRARYYDGGTGRWMSEDPIGFDAGDYNLSRYALNKVSFFIDPSGLSDKNGTNKQSDDGVNYTEFPSGQPPAIVTGDYANNRRYETEIRERFWTWWHFGGSYLHDIGSWQDIINDIKDLPDGSVGDIILTGHGNNAGIRKCDPRFSPKDPRSTISEIDSGSITPEQAEVLKKKMSPNSVIVLRGCGCGKHKKGMQELADKTGHPVLGNEGTVTDGGDGKWILVNPSDKNKVK